MIWGFGRPIMSLLIALSLDGRSLLHNEVLMEEQDKQWYSTMLAV